MAQTLIKLVAKLSLFSLSHAALQQSASEVPIVNALSLKLASRGFPFSGWYSSSYQESLHQATRVGRQESAAVGRAEALPRAQDHHNMNRNKGVADITEELERAADATAKEVTAADSAVATLKISTSFCEEEVLKLSLELAEKQAALEEAKKLLEEAKKPLKQKQQLLLPAYIQAYEEMRMKLRNGQHKYAVADITEKLERAVDAAEQQIGVRFAADAAAAAEKQQLLLRAYSQAYEQMRKIRSL